jgi:hypothetical protein
MLGALNIGFCVLLWTTHCVPHFNGSSGGGGSGSIKPGRLGARDCLLPHSGLSMAGCTSGRGRGLQELDVGQGGSARSQLRRWRITRRPAAVPSAWRVPGCSVRTSRARLRWGRGAALRTRRGWGFALRRRWESPIAVAGGAHCGGRVVRDRSRRASSPCPAQGFEAPCGALRSHSSSPMQAAETGSPPPPRITSTRPGAPDGFGGHP